MKKIIGVVVIAAALMSFWYLYAESKKSKNYESFEQNINQVNTTLNSLNNEEMKIEIPF